MAISSRWSRTTHIIAFIDLKVDLAVFSLIQPLSVRRIDPIKRIDSDCAMLIVNSIGDHGTAVASTFSRLEASGEKMSQQLHNLTYGEK